MITDSPVVIVGGGMSGLAAAVELSSTGIPALLLEQKPSLGGRAFSFRDSVTGDIVDNGQHILIAGYKSTIRFLATIGTLPLLRVQRGLQLTMHHPERGFTHLRLPPLAPPLNFLAGFLSTSLVSPFDRIRILRAGWSLRREDAAEGARDRTIEEWLDGVGQSVETKRSFWEPLAVSIMNEHIGVASAATFIRSLQAAFFSGGGDASLAVPTVGLSELYTEHAVKFISAHGGRVRCEADVTGVSLEHNRIRGAILRDGEKIPCKALIAAIPPYRVTTLLSPLIPELSFQDFESSPIVSIHLWFQEDAVDTEITGLIGRTVQWVFNRHLITGSDAKGGHLSAVISAASEVVEYSNDDLIALAVRDIRSAYPIGDPIHALVIREKRATYRPRPETERRRPPQATRIPNLAIAGDWTETGLPATIESAVISGERSAGIVREWIQNGGTDSR